MSVANRYKVLSFSGSECFALLRAMRGREDNLVDHIKAAHENGASQAVIDYMEHQLADLQAACSKFSNTPFQEGRPS